VGGRRFSGISVIRPRLLEKGFPPHRDLLLALTILATPPIRRMSRSGIVKPRLRKEVVKIRASCPDPLEFHRVVPVTGRMRYWCFADAQGTTSQNCPRKRR
jgi:hypothetical protein